MFNDHLGINKQLTRFMSDSIVFIVKGCRKMRQYNVWLLFEIIGIDILAPSIKNRNHYLMVVGDYSQNRWKLMPSQTTVAKSLGNTSVPIMRFIPIRGVI